MIVPSYISAVLLISFSVVLAWMAIWITIKNSKILFSLPFLLVAVSSFFYAGLIIYSPPSKLYDLILESLYLLSNVGLFVFTLRRFLWSK